MTVGGRYVAHGVGETFFKEGASMVWLGVVLFIASGIAVLIWRKEVAWGISIFMGANSAPGCSVALAIIFFLMAVAFVSLRYIGVLPGAAAGQ